MEKLLLSHYRKDGDFYCIDVAIDDLEDLFSKHDPSFLHERDLQSALAKYITDQLVVFPKHSKVRIVFHLPKRFKRIEDDIRRAFRHHFEFEYLDSELHMKRRLRKAKHILFFAVMIFVVLMGSSYVMDHYLPDFWVWKLLAEGLFVGSWVAMWHPIEMLLYEWLPLEDGKRMYKHLMETEISFNYK